MNNPDLITKNAMASGDWRKALRSKLPGKLQALYERPGQAVELTEFDNEYEAGVWSWGRDSARTTFFYRGQLLPPAPLDVDGTITLIQHEIQRIDNDLTPQP